MTNAIIPPANATFMLAVSSGLIAMTNPIISPAANPIIMPAATPRQSTFCSLVVISTS
jgi:hypothetical protein